MANQTNGGAYFAGNLRCDTVNGVELYVAKLSQSGTDAPTATVFRNDLDGTVVWARTSAGVYTATLTGAFLAATSALVTLTVEGVAYVARTSANVLTLTTCAIDGDGAAPADDLLSGASIEVKVYN